MRKNLFYSLILFLAAVTFQSVMSSNIQIISASYGAGGSSKDVTAILQSKIPANVSTFTLSSANMGVDKYGSWQNNIFGDPAFGKLKTLNVSYKGADGIVKSVSVQEKNPLTLSVSSTEATQTNRMIISPKPNTDFDKDINAIKTQIAQLERDIPYLKITYARTEGVKDGNFESDLSRDIKGELEKRITKDANGIPCILTVPAGNWVSDWSGIPMARMKAARFFTNVKHMNDPRSVMIKYMEGNGSEKTQIFNKIEGKEFKIVADITKHPAWALKQKLAALLKETELAKTAPNQPDTADYSQNAPKINYGDVIRLTYFPGEKVENGITLHSHATNYDANTSKSTSGQQQVTGMAGEDDNDWWMIASPTKELNEIRNTVVKSGDRIMLIHLSTNKGLHTHTNVVNDTNGWDEQFKSPDNEHREITCYNTDKNNIGNSWLVKIYEGKTPVADGSDWIANKNVVLERYNPNLGNPDYKTDYPEYLWISDKLFGTHQQHIVGLNKTPTYFVVEDIKNKPNYIYGKFIVEIPVNLPTKWFAEDGKFSAIAVGSTTSGEMLKFGIGMDGKLYEFNNSSMSENPWEEFENLNDTNKQPIGQLISLTISVDGNMLVINSDNKVFEFNFTKKVWSEIKKANQPKLTQISCGNDKTIVAKSTENKLYKLGEKEWEEISDEGEMVVATVKSNIFGLGLNGKVYKHTTGKDWTELAEITNPFIYIAAADTVKYKVEKTDATKKSTNTSVKTVAKSKTTKTTTETIEKTVIFAIDKDFALWKLVLGETKWSPVLGKDEKQATGFSRIATNGVSHAALDGENDNYHFGESGIKIAADKTAVVVTPVKTTRTKAVATGKVATKVVAKKTVKAKSTVKKAKSKTQLTKGKKTTVASKTTAKSKKAAKKSLTAKKKAAKKTSTKAVTKKTSAKTVTPTETTTASTTTK